MKNQFADAIVRSVKQSSLSSRILFVLCAISFLLMTQSGVYLILTGFLGVMWLSSIALHAFKNGRAGQRNPFTVLIAACTAVCVLCLGGTQIWEPEYRMELEPVQITTRSIENSLQCYEGDMQTYVDHRILYMDSVHLNAVTHNAILTDADGNVLLTLNDWQWSGSDTLCALYCPSSLSNGNVPTLLTDADGTVHAALLTEENWQPDSRTAADRLTIAAQDSAQEEPTASEALQARYFPSFGAVIDENAVSLVTYEMLCRPAVPTGSQENMEILMSYHTWHGEKITDLPHYPFEGAKKQALIDEMNRLTVTERAALKEYLSWLETALDAARSPEGDHCPNYLRVMNSRDGEYTVYLMYHHDPEALYPVQQEYLKRFMLHDLIRDVGILMIPAIIVFLAFWVFVDAKKRGQTNPALWAILTLIGNVVAWLIYMLVRPQMTISPTGQAAPRGACPLCGTKLKSDFIACPGCGILLRSRCKSCGQALENEWSFCPYCAAAVTKDELQPKSDP